MWTLTLPGGARAAVVAAEWSDAFGVVTRGRVQLELRDGAPGRSSDATPGSGCAAPASALCATPADARRGCVSSRPGPSHGTQRILYANSPMTETT
ncbi:hypothetical protein NKG94_05035 [Micromonospora sp. M12]